MGEGVVVETDQALIFDVLLVPLHLVGRSSIRQSNAGSGCRVVEDERTNMGKGS